MAHQADVLDSSSSSFFEQALDHFAGCAARQGIAKQYMTWYNDIKENGHNGANSSGETLFSLLA